MYAQYMTCEVCLNLQNQLQRESEIETRAILRQRSRWTGGTLLSGPEVDAEIQASRKRQMAIATSLGRHRSEQHSPAYAQVVNA